MSIVLFISASAFTSYLTDSVERSFEGNGYDLIYDYDPTMYMTLEEITNKDFTNSISQEELSERISKAKAVTSSNWMLTVTMPNTHLSR